ncbi:MAG: tetratricopeptide repeat protein [Nitrospirales bacterium]|nr:tetratricopeptide repeat protein [Nitrospirales bacterium]
MPDKKKAMVEMGLLQEVVQLISQETGLNIREQDLTRFAGIISERTKSYGLSPEGYCRLLKTDRAESRREWKEIIGLLTVGETYFFRDSGQFLLLRNSIMPEIIEKNRKRKSLRIWSAGCSSGEEPYSLAILVNELIPQRAGWEIIIVGTDINEKAIEKARLGRYRQWSFRKVSQDTMARYFKKTTNGWILDERIRSMVRFEVGNLVKSSYPDYGSDLHDMDLILCRNVFIYFKPEAISTVVSKMAATLCEGGHLMTGHSEIALQSAGALKARFFPESVIYQKGTGYDLHGPELQERRFQAAEAPKKEIHEPFTAKLPKPGAKEETAGDLKADTVEIEALIKEGSYRSAIGKAESILRDTPHDPRILYLLALAYADSGEYDKAVENCRKAITIAPFDVELYYLLAQIAHDRGEIDNEKDMLKRVIYLSPSHIAAHLELGMIYGSEGDTERASKMRAAALELLLSLPKDAPVEPYAGLTAAELTEHVKRMVEQDG